MGMFDWLGGALGGLGGLFGGAAKNLMGGASKSIPFSGAGGSFQSLYPSQAQGSFGFGNTIGFNSPQYLSSFANKLGTGAYNPVASSPGYAIPKVSGGLNSLFGSDPSFNYKWGSATPSAGGSGGGNFFKSMGNFFQQHPTASALGGGLGLMGLSQMMKNPAMPTMPDEYKQYLNMAMNGGNQYMQQAGNYYEGLLGGDENNEYLRSILFPIEESETEELRSIDQMYKSLRPGTDPLSDSTYQRDVQKTRQKYAETKQRAVAQAKYGGAQGLAGLGGQLGTLQAGAIGPELEMLAAQWGMSASQVQQLRDMFLNTGAGLAMSPIQNQMFLNQLQAYKDINK